MIASWTVRSLAGRSPGDHVCWPYRGREALVTVAGKYLTEGLARGERVAYLADGDPGALAADLSGLVQLSQYVERGQLMIAPLDAMPGSDPSSDLAEELATLAAMTQESLDAGYTGLRVLADVTVRVGDPRRRAKYVHYEHLVDRFCLDHAYTAVCAYNVEALGEMAVAELLYVHPLAPDGLSPFRLRATRTADAALAGSLDELCAAQLKETLRRIRIATAGKEVVIDAVELEFVEHRALLALEDLATTSAATVVLRSPPRLTSRLVELMGLNMVRVEERA